jgi:predicted DNA-binding transcriptional regulator YafY
VSRAMLERELEMDMLKHGPEVEVVSPASLRARLRKALGLTLARYQIR